MYRAVIGPQTAKRLLDIYRPDIQLSDVAVYREVLLTGDVRLSKYEPVGPNDPQAGRFGDQTYVVKAEAAGQLDQIGLEAEQETPTKTEALL